MAVKKLIEVALPLEKINAESAREKSIRHGHPSTLHLWWARRPLAAARAVIWASLVDDPSSHPERFPTEDDQSKERQRLFKILESLVVWENSNDETVLNLAKAEILKSTNNKPPVFLDPFAGGGGIPLEAQRLGLNVHAHDLNPVAVMINKAMIEIPPLFFDSPPVNPEARKIGDQGWNGTCGLSVDISYYGQLMKDEAFKKIGHLYPKITVQHDNRLETNVVAWIWARTIRCPNPVCNCEIPLVKSFDLSKKKDHPYSISLVINSGKIEYAVQSCKATHDGTISRSGARCPCCGSSVAFSYIREQASSRKMNTQLMAIAAEEKGGRVYLSPTPEQIQVANVEKPSDYPSGMLSGKCRVNISLYGFEETSDLFTNRQLTGLCTFSSMIEEMQERVKKDAIKCGLPDDGITLADGGRGALAYSQAIVVYLTFVIDKMTDYHSSICSWHSSGEKMRNTFGRQALPMVWDFAEGNPFSNSSGCFDNMLDWVVKCVKCFPKGNFGEASQFDAQSDCGLRNIMISTDPPYYDNICYADLSDFFYVWMRRILKNIYPSLFSTVLVPKEEELIASPYRHKGNSKNAKSFFEEGMYKACCQLYKYACDDIPVTIYYAYKQNDTDDFKDCQASSGWETMLTAIIKAGFSITGTWPMRTEMTNRQVASGANALASSVVLVCRKRPLDAQKCTRRQFINELKYSLRSDLQKLQNSNIAPVDMAQSAIGPGMGIYSKYSQVLEADGSPMTVRNALEVINQELDLFFNEQDGDLDSESRFCVELYSQVAFNEIKFGDANTLATAKNTSVTDMVSHGVLYAQKGVVHLIERSELPDSIHVHDDSIWLICQQLTYKMEKEGVEGCAGAVVNMFDSNAERAKDLAYRLYTIAERKSWTQESYAYNSLVVAWQDIQARAAELKAIQPKELFLF